MSKVAITGVGIVVPGHHNAFELFDNLLEGKTLINKKKLSPEPDGPTISCASMTNKDIETIVKQYPLLAKKSLSLAATIGCCAALQAARQANINFKDKGVRAGLFIGCNKILPKPEDFHLIWKKTKHLLSNTDRLDALKKELENTRQSQLAETCADILGIEGCVKTFADACSSGSNAILSGYRRILHNQLDVALCGASEHATDKLMQLHFNKLGALARNQLYGSQEKCRPFDKDRSGFVLGDGAGFLVLESLEHAQSRGCDPIAYLVGGSRNTEGYSLVHTDEEGLEYEATMKSALSMARINPRDVSLINAHGTSTLISDTAEARAIGRLFGCSIPVNAIKASTGHAFGGSAAIELVLSAISLKHQKILPTLNYKEKLPQDSELNIITKGLKKELKVILSNTFGLGGENTCLILKKA